MFKVRSLAMAKGFLRSVLNRARYLRFMLRKRGGKLLLLLPTYPVAYNETVTPTLCGTNAAKRFRRIIHVSLKFLLTKNNVKTCHA